MKISRSHTSAIGLVSELMRYLEKSGNVKKLSLGHITSKRGQASGVQKIKIRNDGTCIHLTVTENNSVQVVRIFGNNLDHITEIISSFAKEKKISLLSDPSM